MCNISAQESHHNDAVIRLFGKTISVKNDEKGDEFHRKEKRQFPFNGVQTVAKLIKTENTEENDPGRFHGKASAKKEEEMKSETESSADSSSKGVIKADDGNKKVSPTPSKGGGKVVPCPRCNSMETKFCYYNNYNVNQPRHFCRNCRRYWTAGGTIRNIPVGAGRRKSKHFQGGGLSLSLGVAGSVDDSDSNSSCGVQIFNQGFKVCEVSSTSALGKILQ